MSDSRKWVCRLEKHIAGVVCAFVIKQSMCGNDHRFILTLLCGVFGVHQPSATAKKLSFYFWTRSELMRSLTIKVSWAQKRSTAVWRDKLVQLQVIIHSERLAGDWAVRKLCFLTVLVSAIRQWHFEERINYSRKMMMADGDEAEGLFVPPHQLQLELEVLCFIQRSHLERRPSKLVSSWDF